MEGAGTLGLMIASGGKGTGSIVMKPALAIAPSRLSILAGA
jgi:hypothetical protein